MNEIISQVTREVTELFGYLLPQLVEVLILVLIAYVLIQIALRISSTVLDRVLSEEHEAIREFWIKLTEGILWFSGVLILLNVLEMESLAASLGTATGFVALGVAYAMKDILSDLVAGLYLIRDDQFQPGDRIVTSVVTGELKSIEFRKCRFRDDDGNDVVVANTDVEKKWTRVRKGSGEGQSTETGAE